MGAADGDFVVDQAGLKVPTGDGRQVAKIEGLATAIGVQGTQIGEARLQEEPEDDVLDASAAVDRSPAAVAVEDDSGAVAAEEDAFGVKAIRGAIGGRAA